MRRIVKNDHGSIKLVLLALVMLTPFTAWADYYDIAIQYGTKESDFHSVLVTGNPNDVGGNPNDILGDGTMSYDQDNNVLTLNGVNLTCSYGSADFISHNGFMDSEQVVTVHLVGSNTVTLGNNSYFFEGKQITFTAADNNASLTIVTQDGREIGIFSDRATPTYNSHLFLEKISENEYYIQTLTCQIGSFPDNNNNIVVRFGDDTGCTDEKTHYSIDYVDENLQDVTNAEWVYNDDDVTLLGPCTMTYYKTAGGGQSETMTAKLFGLATNSVTTTLGTPVAPPTIVPAFDHIEDLIITEIENPASGVAPVYNGTTGLISTSAVGETTCSVKLGNSTANGYDYLVLNENDDKQKHIFGDFTLTVSEPPIWIGSVEVNEDGTFPDYGETALFDAETSTLTLNGISYSGEITSGLDELTIKVTGTNNQIGKIVSLNPAATLTFEKASAEAAASLTLSTAQMTNASAVISGFANVNWGDMYLSSSTPYQYDTTNKLLVNPTAEETEELTSATITSETTYPLWVGGTQVTGSSVLSDNIRSNGVYDGDDYGITFTAGETNLLQLKRVGIHISENHKPAIVSGLDNLTIQLEDRNQIYFNGDYACYMVASAKENATLTFKASGDDALLTANIGDSQYIGSPANGFQTVSYDNNLVYIAYGTSTQSIKKLDAPTVSLSDGYLMLSSNDSNEGNIESLVIKYSVDYADASLTDVTDATYDEEGSPAISSPCTITAHAEYNGKTGIEATAKYFGFTEPMQVVYAGTAAELPALPALVPAIADGDDVTYQIGSEPEGTAVSYDEQTEKYMVQGVGTAVLEINLMQGDNTPYNVLNEVAQLTVNVIPTAPTIELAEGEHLSSETVSITSTITGAVIKYKWNDGTAQTYAEEIPVQTGILTAWVEYTDGTTTVSSEEVTAEYTVKTDIATLYVAPIEDITYTGSAVTPTIVVKATEEAEVSLVSGTDYTVSYKQGETAVAAAALINVATYTVVISGNGSYGGTKEVTFKIIKATPNITFAQESYSATLGESFTSPATVDNWTVSPTASSNTSVANISEGQIVLVGVGTTMITVTYAGNDNYNSTTASYELVVSRALDIAFAGTNSWASYYATENLAVPEGLTAYVVSAVNEETGAVTVASVDYLPANNAVLLKREQNGDASGYTATAYTDDPEPIENNLLAGSVNTTDISTLGNTPVYVLFNDQFKRATSGTIPARRAYLPLGAAVAPAHARQSMNINISDGSVTAIKTLTVDDTNDSWYTIDGLKLNGKPQRKGLYINKGKKVYINSNK